MVLVGIAIGACLGGRWAGELIASNSRRRSAEVESFQRFARWQAAHSKMYHSPAELIHRLQIFSSHVHELSIANNRYRSAFVLKYGREPQDPFEVNKFADLDAAEFRSMYAGDETTASDSLMQMQPSVQLSDGLSDTCEYQIRVRDQGICGSCWAFAAVASVEKMYYDIYKQQLELSQQQLVDSDSSNRGCSGGIAERAFAYIGANGLSLLSDYPYVGDEEACRPTARRVAIPAYYNRLVLFSVDLANLYSKKGYHATLSLHSSNLFRFLGQSDEVFDASLVEDCGLLKDHAVTMLSAAGQVITILNSWGVTWGSRGTKRIKACGPQNLMGRAGRIGHPIRDQD